MDTPVSNRRSPLWILRLALYVGGPAIATLLGFLGNWHWRLDLLSHFRAQYAVWLAFAALVLLLLRHPREAGAALAFALVNLVLIAPLYFSRPQSPLSSALPLHVATFNAFAGNKEREKAWKFIQEKAPEIVLILEFQKGWEREFLGWSPQYKLLVSDPRDTTLGLALLARIPTKESLEMHLDTDLGRLSIGHGKWNSALVRFEWEGKETWLLGIHPAPPVEGELSRLRDLEFSAIGRWVQGMGERPVLVAGDFNATPWSRPFRKLVDETNLVNSLNGFGLQATWCEGCGLLSFFKIPIDHVLHSRHWTTVERDLAPPLGSDHRMVLATLEWAK